MKLLKGSVSIVGLPISISLLRQSLAKVSSFAPAENAGAIQILEADCQLIRTDRPIWRLEAIR